MTKSEILYKYNRVLVITDVGTYITYVLGVLLKIISNSHYSVTIHVSTIGKI